MHPEPAPGPEHEGRGPAPEHHPLLESAVEAAVEAEFATGVHEETVEAAKRHILFRLGRMALGFTILILGLLAIPLPGPGWLIVGLGLGILAQDFVWAERTLNIVRKRLPQDADGKIPKRTWVIIGLVTAATASASIWWSFFR